jgi:small acid-soluble spore protein H (minor)
VDINRVKQILSSSSRIDVTYHGVPVWIENCDEASGIANVHDLKTPHETVQVEITSLEEH